MGTRNLSVSLNLNSAGFMSQECPSCERTFKVQPGRGSPNPVRHCPYCNHEGENCWLTKAQAKYLGDYTAHAVVGPELGKMFRDLERGSRGAIKVTTTRSPAPSAPGEADDSMPSLHFGCCGETIRHDGRSVTLHCPICGAVATAATAEPTA